MFTQTRLGNWHPLTWLSHAVDYAAYGLELSGHHLTSVALHCLNSALVFALAHLLLGALGFAQGQRLIAAAVTGLLFGLHPLHVESVAWIAQRKTVLCQLFSLLSTLGYLIYAGTPPERKAKRSGLYALSLASFCLALLAKTMAVTLPAVLLILDVFPLKRIRLSRGFRLVTPLRDCWRPLMEKLPFFACTGVAIPLTIWAQGGGGAILPTEILGMPLRLLNAASAVVLYLLRLVVPTDLSPLYPILPLPGIQEGPLLLLPPLAIAGITALALREWRRGRQAWLACWAIFLLTLSPVAGIVQVGTQGAADRYAYLPTLPFLLLFGSGVAVLAWRGSGRLREIIRVGLALACALATAGLFSLTQRQVEVWRSDTSLWSHAAAIYPDDFGIRINLGDAHRREGRDGEALAAYQRALALGDATDMIARYQRAKRVSPYGRLYQRIGEIHTARGRYREALAIYQHVVEQGILIPLSRPTLYYNMAGLQLRLHRNEEAMALLREALRIDPQHARSKTLLEQLQAGR